MEVSGAPPVSKKEGARLISNNTSSMVVVLLVITASAAATVAASSPPATNFVLLDFTTNRLLGKTLSGKTTVDVTVASARKAQVYPGAVAADGGFAINPASVNGTKTVPIVTSPGINSTVGRGVNVPFFFVTDLSTSKVSRIAAPPAGQQVADAAPPTDCNFADISQFGGTFAGVPYPAGDSAVSYGTYVALGKPGRHGTPLVYALACDNATTVFLVTGTYANGKVTRNETVLLQNINRDTGDTRPFVSGNFTARELAVFGSDDAYVVGTANSNPDTTRFPVGAVAVFKVLPATLGSYQQVGALQTAFDFHFADYCSAFVATKVSGNSSSVAAICLDNGPLPPVSAVFKSRGGRVAGSNTTRTTTSLAASAEPSVVYELSTPAAKQTEQPATATVYRVNISGSAARPYSALFRVPNGFRTVAYAP